MSTFGYRGYHMVRSGLKMDTDRAPVGQDCLHCDLTDKAFCWAVSDGPVSAGGHARVRPFGPGETIQAEGRVSDFAGILRRGLLRRVRVNRDGRRNLIEIIRPGDLLGVVDSGPLDFAVESVTDAEICLFDAADMRRKMARDPILRQALMARLRVQYDRQLKAIWLRGALTSRERIIAFLLYAREFVPVEPAPDGGIIVTMLLTRRDWADLSGTTLETICRLLGDLAQEGLVTPEGAQRYRIADIAALAQLAGLESDALSPVASRAARIAAE